LSKREPAHREKGKKSKTHMTQNRMGHSGRLFNLANNPAR